jgi:DNA repair exonuclease SbcCD ATPase subunit
MYRRIIGFFGGSTSESSEDTQELTQGRNEVGDIGETSDSRSRMAEGELRELRNRIVTLEHDLKVRTEESENYKNKHQLVEKELKVLQIAAAPLPISKVSVGVGDGVVDITEGNTNESESSLNTETPNMEELMNENSELLTELTRTGELLKDKTDLCERQEKKNIALTNQIESLKEVVAITKDLLNIRDMEVKHLQSDMESMEEKISEEKQRQNSMITKMEEAMKLNSDLKGEYENQMRIFQELKAKYEQKVTLLTQENEKLEEEVALSRTVQNAAQNNQKINTDNPASDETDSQ